MSTLLITSMHHLLSLHKSSGWIANANRQGIVRVVQLGYRNTSGRCFYITFLQMSPIAWMSVKSYGNWLTMTRVEVMRERRWKDFFTYLSTFGEVMTKTIGGILFAPPSRPIFRWRPNKVRTPCTVRNRQFLFSFVSRRMGSSRPKNVALALAAAPCPRQCGLHSPVIRGLMLTV